MKLEMDLVVQTFGFSGNKHHLFHYPFVYFILFFSIYLSHLRTFFLSYSPIFTPRNPILDSILVGFRGAFFNLFFWHEITQNEDTSLSIHAVLAFSLFL